MAEDEDDLYDEEFDFVDDDDDEVDDGSEIDGEVAADKREAAPAGRRRAERNSDSEGEVDEDRPPGEEPDEEPEDEYGRTAPKPDYVVHIYEYSRFKRTIDRPFTPEDAEAFATEYNRTGKSYGRVAVTGKNETKPKKSLD